MDPFATGLDTYVEIGGRPVALVSIADGGNGCGSMYRIASTGDGGRPVVTREFGNCSGPDVRLDGARMDLHFEPYYTYAASESPGFVAPPGRGLPLRRRKPDHPPVLAETSRAPRRIPLLAPRARCPR